MGGFKERRGLFDTRGAGAGTDLVLVRLVGLVSGSGVFLLLVVVEDRVGTLVNLDRAGSGGWGWGESSRLVRVGRGNGVIGAYAVQGREETISKGNKRV